MPKNNIRTSTPMPWVPLICAPSYLAQWLGLGRQIVDDLRWELLRELQQNEFKIKNRIVHAPCALLPTGFVLESASFRDHHTSALDLMAVDFDPSTCTVAGWQNPAAGEPERWPIEIWAFDLFEWVKIGLQRLEARKQLAALASQIARQARVSEPREASRTFSQAALRNWYRTRVTKWPNDLLPPTAKDDLAAARKDVSPHVARDAIRKLRGELAPESWKAGGRRPKTSRE